MLFGINSLDSHRRSLLSLVCFPASKGDVMQGMLSGVQKHWAEPRCWGLLQNLLLSPDPGRAPCRKEGSCCHLVERCSLSGLSIPCSGRVAE